jgi:hypothetical protein
MIGQLRSPGQYLARGGWRRTLRHHGVLAPSHNGAALLALLITLVPIRRAVRYRHRDALRYT